MNMKRARGISLLLVAMSTNEDEVVRKPLFNGNNGS